MKSFQGGELTIDVNVTNTTVRLVWLGKSVAREPSAVLRPFFDQLAPYLVKTRELDIDFRGFEFMNSSTIKPILTFVQSASQGARKVSVRFDGSKTWQRLSFGVLKALSKSWTNVTVEG
jgi:hypothetical protein